MSPSDPSNRPWWHPDAFARRREALKTRGRILAAVRAWFADNGYLEVETPALQVCPGMEVHLRVFETRLQDAFGRPDRPVFLHTSPELAMKKLLVAGLPRIFQIARVFRNAEQSSQHHPEFSMLEWYQADADYRTTMAEVSALLAVAADAAGVVAFRHGSVTCPVHGAPELLTVAEAFQRWAGIDLLATVPDPDDRDPDPAPLRAEAARIGVRTDDLDRWEDVFFRIAFARIEPHLGRERPTILLEWPACMAALARRKPGDPRVAERFELYVAGVELANAFSELTDPDEQAARFRHDAALRARLHGHAGPVDEDFLAALRFGMPPAAGIALGLDRLVMLATGAGRIEDVLWAPVTPPPPPDG